MLIEGREIREAKHDTGAENGNFIALDLVNDLQLHIRQNESDRKTFSLGNGKVVRSVGMVKASCAFVKEAQTSMRCWFHVFERLASPLIMGLEFLEKTKTLSHFTGRLDDRLPNASIVPMVNFIGSAQRAKRRFSAFINDSHTYVNADSGSDLDLMSFAHVRRKGYKIDRSRDHRKRIQLADTTVVETIGQVRATLTLENGRSYSRLFDVLPGLASDVLIGETTLDEINAFTTLQNSFVDIPAGEGLPEFCILGFLRNVNRFLAHKIIYGRRGSGDQQQGMLIRKLKILKVLLTPNFLVASRAKRQDDALLEDIRAEDLEAERHRLSNDLKRIDGFLERAQITHRNQSQMEAISSKSMNGQPAIAPEIPLKSVRRKQASTEP